MTDELHRERLRWMNRFGVMFAAVGLSYLVICGVFVLAFTLWLLVSTHS